MNAVPGTPAAEAGFGEAPALVTAVNGRTLDGGLAAYCSAIDGGEGSAGATFTVVRSGSSRPSRSRSPSAEGAGSRKPPDAARADPIQAGAPVMFRATAASRHRIGIGFRR